MTTLPMLVTTPNQWQQAFYRFGGEAPPLGLAPHPVSLLSAARALLRPHPQDVQQVTSQDVFVWAYGKGPTGKTPGSVTAGARIACLPSFYRFLILHGPGGSEPLRHAGAAEGCAECTAGSGP